MSVGNEFLGPLTSLLVVSEEGHTRRNYHFSWNFHSRTAHDNFHNPAGSGLYPYKQYTLDSKNGPTNIKITVIWNIIIPVPALFFFNTQFTFLAYTVLIAWLVTLELENSTVVKQ